MFQTDPRLGAAINPRVRKSPFWDRTVELGLSAVTAYNHMWLPTSYGDADAEYERIVNGVSIWDVSAQRHVEVAGPDAAHFVAYTTVIDTTSIEPGHATYAPVVNDDGQLLNDPILIHLADGSWRFSIADSDLGLWLDAIALHGPFTVEVTELATSTIAVQGPHAPAVGFELGLDLGSLRSHAHRWTSLAGAEVIFSNSGWSTQPGFELFCDDPTTAVEVWDAVVEAGQSHDLGPAAPNQAERIEGSLLSYGTDTGYNADPYELGLGHLVHLDGPPFIGAPALAQLSEQGRQRRLTGCVVDGDRLDGLGHPVPLDPARPDFEQIRAVVYSPRRSQNIGVALVGVDRPDDEELSLPFPDGTRTVRLHDELGPG